MSTDNPGYLLKEDVEMPDGSTLHQVGWLAHADTDHESLWTDVAAVAWTRSILIPVYTLEIRS